MFEQATATADSRHRTFFDRSGEVRQVRARRADGTIDPWCASRATPRRRTVSCRSNPTCAGSACVHRAASEAIAQPGIELAAERDRGGVLLRPLATAAAAGDRRRSGLFSLRRSEVSCSRAQP